MWKKMQFARSREPAIGNPTLIGTTLDQNSLRAMPRIPGALNDKTGNKSSKDLPALPRESQESNASTWKPYPDHPAYKNYDSDEENQYSDGHNPRPRSSFYSDMRYSNAYALKKETLDISPPDSPFPASGNRNRRDSDISSLEDEPKQPVKPPQKENRFTTQLPVLRKATGPGSPTTKRDTYSGEPTTHETGRAAQTTPGNMHFQEKPVPKTVQHHRLFGRGKDQIRATKKTVEGPDQTSRDKYENVSSSREPWKGASGRSAIVSPIKDRPDPRPQSFAIPSKWDKRHKLQKPASPDRNLSASLGFLPTTTTTITGGGNHPSDVTKPTVPPKADNYNASTVRASNSEAWASGGRHTKQEPDLPARFDDMNLEDRPFSRFSATTYATTEAGSNSGSRPASPDADAPPVPAIPSPMMARRRPIPSSAASIKSTTRKPTPSEVIISDAEKSKALPQSPVEVKYQSRIEMLEAKRGELGRRRANINTIIRELTQVVQPSSTAYDVATRSEVKKTVASLNSELAEINKEEHDVGLKILRAWKKRDEECIYESGTSLWVKRMTS